MDRYLHRFQHHQDSHRCHHQDLYCLRFHRHRCLWTLADYLGMHPLRQAFHRCQGRLVRRVLEGRRCCRCSHRYQNRRGMGQDCSQIGYHHSHHHRHRCIAFHQVGTNLDFSRLDCHHSRHHQDLTIGLVPQGRRRSCSHLDCPHIHRHRYRTIGCHRVGIGRRSSRTDCLQIHPHLCRSIA